MYLILCWSYLNHSLRFVGEKKRIQKKNRILNRNSHYLCKKSQLDYFPKSFSPSIVLFAHLHDLTPNPRRVAPPPRGGTQTHFPMLAGRCNQRTASEFQHQSLTRCALVQYESLSQRATDHTRSQNTRRQCPSRQHCGHLTLPG